MNTRQIILSALSLVILAGASLSASCSDSPVGPAKAAPGQALRSVQGGSVANVSGQWNFQEQAVFVLYEYSGAASKAFRCSDQGTYDFVQAGSTFSGTYSQTGSCAAQDGTTMDLTFNGTVINGVISGNGVRFETADGCAYVGALSGPSRDIMQGGGQCGGGHVFGTYRPRWTAKR